MNKIDKLARAIKDSAEDKNKTSAYDTTAEVISIDEEGTAWVKIPGGVERTPAQMLINAKKGDSVRVRVSGGKAYVMGNATAPPTDDTTALRAESEALRASAAANKAASAADSAHRSAVSAQSDATKANNAANQAVYDADRAHKAADQAVEDAAIANTAAQEAKADASSANRSANSALIQLSTVESVVDTLNWITDHASYELSEDTEVQEGVRYFTRSGSGTEEDPYSYTLVASPEGSPVDQGYYIIGGIQESVTNYIQSHLALTDDGLYILTDTDGYKVRIASDGVYVVDPEGTIVSKFGESIEFASERPQHIGGEDAYIIYYDSDDDGYPDSILISGTKISFGDKPLSQLLSEVDANASDIVALGNATDASLADLSGQIQDNADAITSVGDSLTANTEALQEQITENRDFIDKYEGYITIDPDVPIISLGKKDSEGNQPYSVGITDQELSFNVNGEKRASATAEEFTVDVGRYREMRMRSAESTGEHTWFARSNGHLSLKLTTD